MSTSYTANLGLGIPAVADRQYNLAIDPNWPILDGMAALGPLAVSANETPSVSASVAVAAGTFRASNGSEVSYAGTTGLAVTTSTTTVVYLDEAGTIHTASSYPVGPIVKLGTVTADTGSITSVVDDRRVFSSNGLGRLASRTVTATTDTPARTDGLILCNATSNAIASTLPTFTTADAGFPLILFKTDSTANAVTIATASGVTITLANKYDAAYVVWSGTEWECIVGPVVVTPLTVRAKEYPSTTLNVRIAAGTFRATNGSEVTYAGTSSLAVTTATNTMIWLTDAGTIATGSAYPVGPIVRLATVAAGATTVTSIVDDRRVYAAMGGLPRLPVRTVTAATDTPTKADGIILADSTANVVAFTMPTLTTAESGLPMIVKRTNAGANNVTVATVDGGTTTLSAQYQSVRMIWSGSAWFAV